MFHLTKRYRSGTAYFLLILFLTFLVGCNYYRVKTRYQGDEDFTKKLNESLNKENILLFVKGSQTLLAKDFYFDGKSITAELDSLPIELQWLHDEMAQSGTNRFNSKKHGSIVHEVRIYPDQDQPLELGSIDIPVDNVKRIDIYDHDTAKEILSFTATVVGIFGVIMLIVALTKSSCPYVYSYNGNDYAFEGESYGGAIFKPLERMDYVPLVNIDTVESIKSVRIANQLKERQYLNQVNMIELLTPPGVSALLDKNGEAHTYQHPISPIRSIADQVDYNKHLTSPDSGRFLFNTGTSGASHIDLEFPNQPQEAKLIINAKGSLWLDYLYGEFSTLFGEYYTEFIQLQHNRSREDIERWIHDQDLLLSVYEQTTSGWELIDRFDMVGPLGEGRDLVMTLPVNKQAQPTRTIRLETGFMLWELNYAALDYTPDQILRQRAISPLRVLDHHDQDQLEMLERADSRYLVQRNIGDFVNIDFEVPTTSTAGSAHYFLAVKGYYEHIRDFQGLPQLQKLALFKNPGHFSRFSRQVHQSLQVDVFAANSEPF